MYSGTHSIYFFLFNKMGTFSNYSEVKYIIILLSLTTERIVNKVNHVSE